MPVSDILSPAQTICLICLKPSKKQVLVQMAERSTCNSDTGGMIPCTKAICIDNQGLLGSYSVYIQLRYSSDEIPIKLY